MAGPFKMKGWSPFTKKSPTKDIGHDPEREKGHKHGGKDPAYATGIEVHGEGPQKGQILIIDESGKSVPIGTRPDLVKKRERKASLRGKSEASLKGKSEAITETKEEE